MTDVVVATRFFEKDIKKVDESTQRLEEFCKVALDAGACRILVAVNVTEDKSGLTGLGMPFVTLFPVQPWGKFAMPLNAILVQGKEYWKAGAFILSASVEVTVSKEAVNTLSSYMDENTLVVGAALLGHAYEPGLHAPASGRQTPWNTLSLWNPQILWNGGGFSVLGDGPLGSPENAGMEEVITIASIQFRNLFCNAKLVQIHGQKWDTSHFDDERLAAHEKKMASKDSRPAAQLVAARMPGPTVFHV